MGGIAEALDWRTCCLTVRGSLATPAAATDEELVASSLEGRNEAFEALVLRHRRTLTLVARRYFADVGDAEEMAQEAFVKAYLNLAKLKPGVPFKNWLIRITINTCLDRLRRERRRGEMPVSQMSEAESAWLERHLFSASEEERRKLERGREAEALLARVLPLLAPKDQMVLHLLHGEERDVAEVARILGWSRANVKVRAYRARRAMRKALLKLIDDKEQGS
jgi:RNA polymerase sigma-70 factor (ECF subfamily)